MNPFIGIPVNAKKVYVRGVDNCGCQIFVPVDSDNQVVQSAKKDGLQDWLDNQFHAASA